VSAADIATELTTALGVGIATTLVGAMVGWMLVVALFWFEIRRQKGHVRRTDK
jgi:hypothetical protein